MSPWFKTALIPVSLYLKNFLSYGDNVPPLDFTEFNIACLSGNNGHGKSAVLDAMTWALWGEARKAAGEKSPSDGLLRIGATEMQVELEFDLAGDRYRALRKFHKTRQKKGVLSLEFQVFDETSQAYKSLTEKTLKATQDKIDRTLRMNYDTFINSAFILQGRVDEFTQKSPGKRKEILAEILDLSRYEALKELAKKHYQDAEKDYMLLAKQVELIREELQSKDEYEQKLQELQETLSRLDAALTQQKTRRASLEAQRAELLGKQHQLNDKKQRQKSLREECERLDARRKRQEKQIEDVNAILAWGKEILAAYNQYEKLTAQNADYEEKLRQKLIYQTQQNTLEQAIQHALHELEKRLNKWQIEHAQTQKVLNETRQVLDKAQEIEQGFQELQTGRERDEQREEQRNTVDALDCSIKQVEEQIFQQKSQIEAQLHALQKELGVLHQRAAEESAREKQVQECQEAVARLEGLEKELEQCKETGLACRAQIESLKAKIPQFQEQKQAIQEKVALLKRSEQPQCPLCGSELNDQKKIDLDAHFHQELARIETEEQQTEQAIREHDARVTELLKQHKQIQQQLKGHEQARKQLAQDEHALQESRAARKQLEELMPQANGLRQQLQEHTYAPHEQEFLTELRRQKAEIGYDAKAHQALKQRIKSLRRFEGEYSKLEDTRARQRKTEALLPDIEREIAHVTSEIERHQYAPDEQQQLRDVLTHIQEIGYDEQAHKQIKKDLQKIQDAPVRKEQLEQASKTLSSLRQTLEEIVEELQQKTELRVELQNQIVDLEQELEQLQTVEAELTKITAEMQMLRQERDTVLQTQATYQHKYDHCKELERKVLQQEAEKKQVEKDRAIYEHLMKIFGKDGIQAHLIDNAIPEIEEEAKAILSRLTDNRTTISIESVKDLQSGGTKETLEIKISDELGTRNYEMYSGGEAFRVDFAIRIALSKLLANRAGTQLKTLVIDEGFGTQDARGLEQLVEAIKAISADFEKILVITHLESLKNAFPVRIEVFKYPDIGSQFQIVH